MNNILKLALIGGAAYLAYDYFKKRKTNGLTVAENGNGEKTPASNELLDAEMQEEGEEGMAIEEPVSNFMGYGEKRKMNNSFGRFGRAKISGLRRGNGWDSNVIDTGI